jgi:hypothetical protein
MYKEFFHHGIKFHNIRKTFPEPDISVFVFDATFTVYKDQKTYITSNTAYCETMAQLKSLLELEFGDLVEKLKNKYQFIFKPIEIQLEKVQEFILEYFRQGFDSEIEANHKEEKEVSTLKIKLETLKQQKMFLKQQEEYITKQIQNFQPITLEKLYRSILHNHIKIADIITILANHDMQCTKLYAAKILKELVRLDFLYIETIYSNYRDHQYKYYRLSAHEIKKLYPTLQER